MPEMSTVDLTPIVTTALEFIAVVFGAAATWALRLLMRKLRLSADNEVRLYLEAALQAGLGAGLAKARNMATDTPKIELKSAVVAEAANYAIARVPDALKRFGLTDDAVREMVLARLERAAGVDPTPVPPSP